MVSYQGESLESLNGQLEQINIALAFDLENWERKEYDELRNDVIIKIAVLESYLESL